MKMKTIRDLAAEMRTLADDIEAGRAIVGQTVWRNYADLIESAAKRDAEMAYLNGQLDEITSAVTKFETWRGALWFRLSRLQDEMRNRRNNTNTNNRGNQ